MSSHPRNVDSPAPTRRHRGRPRKGTRRVRRRDRRTTRSPRDAASLQDFQDPFQVPGSATNVPSAVVSPTSVEDVQAVVRIANEYRIPLWPIGRGKNNGYGGAAPQVRGSVMLSFRNMNRVLEINEELGYAIVEPGVSWYDLHDAIKAGGHDLVASIVDIGWGGVVSNTLEHGLTYMPYSIDQASHCGFEVVLPDGDLCAPARAPWTTTRPGRCTSAASARRPPRCSCSRTTASSRRWATG